MGTTIPTAYDKIVGLAPDLLQGAKNYPKKLDPGPSRDA
jgi:hypothetical protein